MQGARLIDGSGNAAFTADIGVSAGSITAVGDLSAADATDKIDARGLTVAPGFIDIHAHSDLTNMVGPSGESKIRQGITLETNGQCGYSPFPVRPECRAELDALNPFVTPQPEWTWQSTDEFLSALQACGPSMNLCQMVGHSALRGWVMGFGNRPASTVEIMAICNLAEVALDEGAVGVSFGLAYALGSFARYDEVEAVCEVCARKDALVTVHLRDEGEGLVDSLGEMIDIARRVSDGSPLRLQIDHLKASGMRSWGRIGDALEVIEAARDEGLDIGFDCYPYTAGSRHLSGSLPAWMHDGGQEALVQRLLDPDCRARLRETHDAWERGEVSHSPFELSFDRIRVTEVSTEENAWTVGKSLEEIAQTCGLDPIEATLDFLAEERGQISVVLFSMDEADMRQALAHPLGCIATDGLVFAPNGPLSSGRPHPRSYGTYPRAIGHYARDLGLMPMEEAVRKCTSLPASRLGIADRGRIAAGMKADLVVFEAERIIDTATFDDPHRFPEGIAYVIANGRVSVEGETNLNAGAGEVLRRAPSSL